MGDPMADQTVPLTAGQKIAAMETKVKFWKAVALCAGHNKLSASEVEKMVLYNTDDNVTEAQVTTYMNLAKAIATNAKS